MKKSLVVLLIVVLAVGSAFAAISGKFTGTYTYDIDNSKLTWGPANGTKFEFEVVADTKTTANEGEVYAKLAAKVEFDAVDTDRVNLKTAVKVTEASINGADWKLDLYADIKAPNYAKSAIDTFENADGDDEAVDFKPAIATLAKGIKFTKAGYSAGFLANYDATETIGLVGETKEFVSGDIKAQAAAAFSTVDSVKTVAGSVKAAYGEIATVAADMQYAADTFDYEVAANVKYAPVTFDFYYSSALATGAVNPKLLSAKLVADLAEYAPAKLTVTAKNLLALKTFDVEVETTAVADTVLTVYGKGLLTTNKLGAKAVYTGVEKTKLTLDASYALATKAIAAAFDAEYTEDLYTAAFGADFGYTTAASLKLDASVKSTKLVSGATLKLAYASGELLGDAAVIGAVTASCEIAF